jgi:SAM-dependent methyltransferase
MEVIGSVIISYLRSEKAKMTFAAIHPDDDMFTGDREHYERCGRQFASLIEKAASISTSAQQRCLELPCGYGRVTRHLVDILPRTLIDSADIMAPCVEWVSSTFGVNAIQVVEPVNEFANIVDGLYSVAAMGSLITHLSEENTRSVIAHFLPKLSPGGVALITTHGQRSHDALVARRWFDVSDEDREALLRAYAQHGHGFVNYSDSETFERKTVETVGDAYGVSITHKDWMASLVHELNFSVIEFIEGGWDDHQDVFFIARS